MDKVIKMISYSKNVQINFLCSIAVFFHIAVFLVLIFPIRDTGDRLGDTERVGLSGESGGIKI